MAKAPGKKDPNVFDKINFIIKFFMDPCDAPWTMYALPIAGAALEAFVSLYSIDLSDIFWAAIGRRYGLNRFRGGRKGRKGSKSIRGFDPNQNIGHLIGTFNRFVGVKIPVGLGFLWISFGVLQALIFFIFLADVIVQFFYRWTSLMYESRFCQAQKQATALATGPGGVWGGIFPPVPIPTPEILKQRGPLFVGDGTIGIPKGWSGVVTGSCNYTPNEFSPPTEVAFWLIKLGTPDVLDYQIKTAQPGEPAQFGIGAEFTDGGLFQFIIDVSSGFGDITSPVVFCQAEQA